MLIVYLLSHNRTMADVLGPVRLDIAAEFSRGFNGMTERSVTLDEMLQAREDLIGNIVGQMPADHRRFLISVKRGELDWVLNPPTHLGGKYVEDRGIPNAIEV